MIEPESRLLCGHPFNLSRSQTMQLLIFRNQVALFEKAYISLVTDWEQKFSTMEMLCKNMMSEVNNSVTVFLDELQNLFWDQGEEIPYDDEKLSSELTVAIATSDLYDRIYGLRDKALSIANEAQNALSDVPDSYFSGNAVNIGFGLRGAVELGIASAGLGLLDYGIDKFRENRTIKKYQGELKNVLHGQGTKQLFAEFIRYLTTHGCECAMQDIAEQNGEVCVLTATHSDWNKRRPSYAKLSTDEKIAECLYRLESAPLYDDLYLELMELTDGRSPELIAFGNDVIGFEMGSTQQREVGTRKYNAATSLPENSLQDIEFKIAAMQDAYLTLDKDPEEDKVYVDLVARENQMAIDERVAELMALFPQALITQTPEELLSNKNFYLDNAFAVWAQELAYTQNEFQLLPSASLAQTFAERGNGLPKLIREERTPGISAESIALLSYWARKGNPYALFHLGLCRLHGLGIEKDTVRSRQFLLKAANAGYPPALYLLIKIASGEYKTHFGVSTREDKNNYAPVLKALSVPPDSVQNRIMAWRKKATQK